MQGKAVDLNEGNTTVGNCTIEPNNVVVSVRRGIGYSTKKGELVSFHNSRIRGKGKETHENTNAEGGG